MAVAWAAWLLVVIVTFAAFETYALQTNRTTLSRFVWNATKAWPPLPFIVGLIIGFVCAHFWWGGSLICY